MSYHYASEKPKLFSEEGQVMFIKIRDNVHALLKKAGAVRMQEAMHCGAGGDSWTMLACVDRLVELGEIREVTGPAICGQYRVFVSTRSE